MTVMVGEDLELDVPRLVDETFYVERAVTESGRRFPPRLRDGGREWLLVADGLHPDAAATFRWLQQHRKADPPRCGSNGRIGLIGRRFAWDDRDAGRVRDSPRGNLRAHAGDDVSGRTDEG